MEGWHWIVGIGKQCCLRVELSPTLRTFRPPSFLPDPSTLPPSLLVPFLVSHSPLKQFIVTMAAAQGYPLLCLENPLLGKFNSSLGVNGL